MDELGEKIDEYFRLQKEICQAFDDDEPWRSYPLDDCRYQHWLLVGGDMVFYALKPLTMEALREGEDIYFGELRNTRIFRTPTRVLMLVEGQVDRTILLMVFDAAKEGADPVLGAALRDRCGI